MIVTILSSFMLAKTRKAIQVFPQSWQKLWNLWEIRITVLLSLILQIILILLGNRRKVTDNNILRIILWLAYVSADSVATVSLSVLSNNSGDSDDSIKFAKRALWAPFLLLHLGGPDTVTAYSLEDNDLWLRRLLQLGVQIVVAGYVLLNAWIGDAFDFMTIPILIAGIIKCGERIWALWNVSRDVFRESLLPPPDPGPNYARYMVEYHSKKEEGFDVSLGELIEEAPPMDQETTSDTVQSSLTEMEIVSYAENFLSIFKRLFADLILSFDDIQNTQSFLRKRSSDEAFKVIEVELGFTYDLFYTKSVLVHSLAGIVLRCITFSCTLPVFCVFLVIRKEAYAKEDVIITYVLLIGAIVLEILALSVLLCSDRAVPRLAKHNNHVTSFLLKVISSVPLTRKRWSNRMAQYNLIKFCLKEKPPKCSPIFHKLISIYELLKSNIYKETVVVSGELKDLIFQEFQKKLRAVSDLKDCKQFCVRKGDWVLEKENCLDKLGWSIGLEFDKSILLWHIATDLCFHEDLNNKRNSIDNDFRCKVSGSLSNYMVYLLVMCPFMLPSGIGQIRLRDTCAEATEFFKEFGPILNQDEACKMLYKVCTEIPPSEVKGDRCKSVLFDGCRLAKDIKSLEIEGQWEKAKKWELISCVWIEILCYAASQCKWIDHAQQLRRGGELLTHVWLLMAHLGITEQFQVSQGHARAKLNIQK